MNYIIPIHNEAENISNVVRDIFSYERNPNICIINSASTDDSIALLQRYPVHIIDAPEGYSHALAFGYRYALEQEWDTLIQLDGDGQHHPMYAKGLHDCLQKADWIIGSRHQTGSYGNWGVRLTSWFGTHFFLSTKLMDPSSGYWALNKMMIQRFAEIFPLTYTELPLRMTQLNETRIFEYPIPMRERQDGVSMNSGWKGILHGFRMIKHAYRIQKKS